MARRRTMLFATTLAAGSLVMTVRAQPVAPTQGPYIGLGGGYNLLQAIFAHPRLSPDTLSSTRYRFDGGFVGAGSLGWGFGNGFRLEVEGTYAYNNVSSRVRTASPTVTTGNQGTYGLFGNVFYDVDLTKLSLPVTVVQPYVGLGAGVLWTHFAPLTSVPRDGDVFRLGGTGANFAYQGIVGFGFPIEAVPGLTLTTDYRLVGIQVNSGAAGQSFTRAGLSKGTVDLSPAFNHQFTVGASYAFYHPRPAAPQTATAVAAPVPQPARSYLVFFDWDRADLTDRTRRVIAEAAQATTRVRVTRIEVAGHTDTSGSPRYNEGLSQRRARNVAAELVRLGVPREAIAVRGLGESRPLVPTGDGAREPQNRRVEIVLR